MQASSVALPRGEWPMRSVIDFIGDGARGARGIGARAHRVRAADRHGRFAGSASQALDTMLAQGFAFGPHVDASRR
ncbi:hypothetical protein BN2475_710032 [Paraburkholderia ribeironis]|uniref:Uncharacterized protein n=1 Tax=Paraburkholderia ribeironis TaxID=1247936 RepID=A0A1N7SI33_9BURK|nr:hypothetical protein [Paraburkholderia ribeironis]SIT47062.1 hypothetical protein BN2475_710032 [Paraburkholderia ribeironis]